MIAKRLLAVLIAVAMVALAFVLRAQLQDDDESGAGGTDDPIAAGTVWCVTELEAACDALKEDGYDVKVAPAGEQAEALQGKDTPDVKAWITVDPWPEIVDTFRQAANLEPRFEKTTALTSSELGLVGRTDRVQVLTQACGGALTWECVGRQAGKSWADLGGPAGWQVVKPAHADPTASAVGMAVLGQATASWFHTQDPPVEPADINPVDFGGNFRTWFDNLEKSIPREAFGTAQTPLEIMLTRPVFDVVGTTRAEAEPALATQPQYTVTYPDPVTSATAVVASATDGGLPERDVGKARDALTRAGWVAPVTNPSGLPPAAVMIALQNLWTEVVR